MAAKFEINHGRCRVVSNHSGSSSASILTQILNAGVEVFSVAMSFLTCGTLHIHSDLPGGEKVGRAPFSQAITSIFGNHDVGDVPAEDGISPSPASGSSSPGPK